MSAVQEPTVSVRAMARYAEALRFDPETHRVAVPTAIAGRRSRHLRPAAIVAATLVLSLAAAGCGDKKPAKYPALPDGCAVEIFHEIPTGKTENLGEVRASCEESVSEQDCMRTFKDEACRLGADVVWGVDEKPTRNGLRFEWHGRAAHTVSAPTSAPRGS